MFTIDALDVAGLEEFGAMMVAAGDKAPDVVMRALRRTGDTARSRVVRALAAQVGLTQKRIRQDVSGSMRTKDEYTIYAFGGEVPLKEFGARETGGGVSAAPFGDRQIFDGSFMRGGKFPGRVDIGMGGHVFERTGSRRLPIRKVASGVVIPNEMVQGESLAAFEATVETVLPRRIDHELSRLFG